MPASRGPGISARSIIATRDLPPLLLKLLRAEPDLVVGDNEPYAVSDETDYTIPVHGEKRGLMNTGIEIRQDLIADQAGQQQWADRLARIFGEIEATLRAQRLILSSRAHRARVSASQMPPPIMKPPETRDTSRVRRAEKNVRARPASSA